jgi:hypothetical protein
MAGVSNRKQKDSESVIDVSPGLPTTREVEPDGPVKSKTRRSPVLQADVPAYSLDDALRVPSAIGENYAYKATIPLDVAAALSMQPGSGTFKMLTGAAVAYGLATGGYNASSIAVTPLGRRILEPTEEGDDLRARQEAVLKPRIMREFLTRYDGNRFSEGRNCQECPSWYGRAERFH